MLTPRCLDTDATRWDDSGSVAAPEPLVGELAWCLERFITATVDEAALLRAQQALAAWQTLLGSKEAG